MQLITRIHSHSPSRGAMTVQEAGRRGGNKRHEQLGHDGFAALGHKGGQRVAELIRQGKLLENQSSQYGIVG